MGNARATSHAEMAREGIANSSSSITHSHASRDQEFGLCNGVGNTFAVERETQVKSNRPAANASSILRGRTVMPGTAWRKASPISAHPPIDSRADIPQLIHPG